MMSKIPSDFSELYVPGEPLSPETPCLISVSACRGHFSTQPMRQKRLKLTPIDFDNRPDNPERTLILAILERALADVMGGDTVSKYDQREAEAWLFSSDTGIFSATWWAEQGDAEGVLRRIRFLARHKLYQRKNARGRIKHCKDSGD